MGKLDDACRDMVEGLDGALACALIDLDSGLLLGIYNAAAYPALLNEVVAAATMELFRGSNVARIEEMVRRHRGASEDGQHYLEEVLLTSRNSHHFAKTLAGGRTVIVLVTRRSTNVGMGWAHLRSGLAGLTAVLP